jgi:hypothetical protein
MEEMKMEKDQAMELAKQVDEAVKSCVTKIEAGEYRSKNEAIDAAIADLTALKEQPGMGGLGEESPMNLPEESAGESEDGE